MLLDEKLKKYWDLSYKGPISKEYTSDLLDLYDSYNDALNKCTVAILLGLIEDDDRVVPKLFDALNYWDDSGYGGWVMTTTARLFNNYINTRKKYLDLMLHGNRKQREILSSALFFFQGPLKNITLEEIDKILNDYVNSEKEEDLKNHILGLKKIRGSGR